VVSVVGDPMDLLPPELRRMNPPQLPELSEVEVVRHFTRLSQMSFGVDVGFYPLGSCTMKYNPKVNEAVVNSDKVHWIHPYQDESTVQGALKLMYRLSQWLSEITGVHRFSLQPAAGAQGEFAGTLIIRAFHQLNRELETRREIIVPDSAHGTNPASAAMAGFKIVVIPSGVDGCLDVDALKSVASTRTAGLMLTNPNTLGLFETDILEISKIIHEVGGLLYYDGANLNAIMGKARPGDMGFDIVHLNLHKTFSTPHGGGGPGSGPVGVKANLDPFLPIPVIQHDGTRYVLDYDRPKSIGRVRSFYGNFETLVRAYAYIRSLGGKGLTRVAELAVLNANYLAHRISRIRGFSLSHALKKPRKHEIVVSCATLRTETGVTATHVAKRLMDFGIHPPTIYFPLIVEEALMIEPTETETLEELETVIGALEAISREAYTTPRITRGAPYNTSSPQIDEVRASHPKTLSLSWRMMRRNNSR
jgi:glycine dehydrogenase subunit 2